MTFKFDKLTKITGVFQEDFLVGSIYIYLAKNELVFQPYESFQFSKEELLQINQRMILIEEQGIYQHDFTNAKNT